MSRGEKKFAFEALSYIRRGCGGKQESRDLKGFLFINLLEIK